MKPLTDACDVSTTQRRSLAWRILPDIFAFGMGLSIAYFLKWETTDLVWSLWVCSLILGYLTLLSALAGGGWIGINLIQHPEFDRKKYFWPAILGGLVIGLFFLAFFSVHFGGFHSIHAVFLGGFFPLEGVPTDKFSDGFMNPPRLIYLVFKYLLYPYGIFIIPALIAERKYIFKALNDAISQVREGKLYIRQRLEEGNLEGWDNKDYNHNERRPLEGAKAGGIGAAMGRPYVNVVRMHLLIFFFAFAHTLKLDSFIVYAVVYFVYFFPWREIRNLKNQTKDSTVSP
jgi:hypothetical protein